MRGWCIWRRTRRLRVLNIRFSRMRDGNMHDLRGLLSLEDLDLSGSSITDRGLDEMTELKSNPFAFSESDPPASPRKESSG